MISHVKEEDYSKLNYTLDKEGNYMSLDSWHFSLNSYTLKKRDINSSLEDPLF